MRCAVREVDYSASRNRQEVNQRSVVERTPSFYGYDGHGNVRFLTQTSGTVGNMYTLDAFGANLSVRPVCGYTD